MKLTEEIDAKICLKRLREAQSLLNLLKDQIEDINLNQWQEQIHDCNFQIKDKIYPRVKLNQLLDILKKKASLINASHSDYKNHRIKKDRFSRDDGVKKNIHANVYNEVNNYYLIETNKKKISLTSLLEVPIVEGWLVGSRKTFLQEIDNIFSKRESGILNIVIISGNDGMGKTQLACKYAAEYTEVKKIYTRTYFINSSTREELEQNFQLLCDEFEIKDKHERVEMLYRKIADLRENCKILFIFDNVRQEDVISDYLPKKISSIKYIYFLITTHYQKLLSEYKKNKINLCSDKNQEIIKQENITFIQETINWISKQEALEIVNLVENLTIAVVQAMYFIDSTKYKNDIQKFVNDFDTAEDGKNILAGILRWEDDNGKSKIPNSFWKLITLIIDDLKEDESCNPAYQLLSQWAYLSSRPFPIKVWLKDHNLENEFYAAIEKLEKRSLISVADNIEKTQKEVFYQMHPLTQRVLTLKIAYYSEKGEKENIEANLMEIIPHISESFKETLGITYSQSRYQHQKSEYSQHIIWWLPHLKKIIWHAKGFEYTSEKLADVYYNIGVYYLYDDFDIRKAKDNLELAEKHYNLQEDKKIKKLMYTYEKLYKAYLKNAKLGSGQKKDYYSKAKSYLKKYQEEEKKSYQKRKDIYENISANHLGKQEKLKKIENIHKLILINNDCHKANYHLTAIKYYYNYSISKENFVILKSLDSIKSNDIDLKELITTSEVNDDALVLIKTIDGFKAYNSKNSLKDLDGSIFKDIQFPEGGAYSILTYSVLTDEMIKEIQAKGYLLKKKGKEKIKWNNKTAADRLQKPFFYLCSALKKTSDLLSDEGKLTLPVKNEFTPKIMKDTIESNIKKIKNSKIKNIVAEKLAMICHYIGYYYFFHAQKRQESLWQKKEYYQEAIHYFTYALQIKKEFCHILEEARTEKLLGKTYFSYSKIEACKSHERMMKAQEYLCAASRKYFKYYQDHHPYSSIHYLLPLARMHKLLIFTCVGKNKKNIELEKSLSYLMSSYAIVKDKKRSDKKLCKEILVLAKHHACDVGPFLEKFQIKSEYPELAKQDQPFISRIFGFENKEKNIANLCDEISPKYTSIQRLLDADSAVNIDSPHLENGLDHQGSEQAESFEDIEDFSSDENFSDSSGQLDLPKSQYSASSYRPSSSEIHKERIPSLKRYGLFQYAAEQKKKIKELIKKDISQKLELGKAIGHGDCFYDAVAQGLNQIESSNTYNIKTIRGFCHQYATRLNNRCQNQWQHENNWIGLCFKEEQDYLNYLAHVQYTSEECRQGKVKNREESLWAKQEVDGIILCGELKIKIHVIEVHEYDEENKEKSLTLTHELIDAKVIRRKKEEEIIPYEDERTVHIVCYNNHFVPILKKTIQLELEQLSPTKKKSFIKKQNFFKYQPRIEEINKNVSTNNSLDIQVQNINQKEATCSIYFSKDSPVLTKKRKRNKEEKQACKRLSQEARSLLGTLPCNGKSDNEVKNMEQKLNEYNDQILLNNYQIMEELSELVEIIKNYKRSLSTLSFRI